MEQNREFTEQEITQMNKVAARNERLKKRIITNIFISLAVTVIAKALFGVGDYVQHREKFIPAREEEA